MMNRATGIDVSHWKPVLDWKQLKNSGVSFVGVKATEGLSYVDTSLKLNQAAVRSNGFVLGHYYHFARSGDPSQQAQKLVIATGPLKPNERLALDFEVMVTPKPEDGFGWIQAFFAALKRLVPDRRHLLYTAEHIWRSIGDPEWPDAVDVDLWIKRYSLLEPILPRPWVKIGWTMWQWTDGNDPSYSTPGVGPCDASYFNGDVMALTAYAGKLIPPPGPPAQESPVPSPTPPAPQNLIPPPEPKDPVTVTDDPTKGAAIVATVPSPFDKV
jgi:lysozyme